MRKKKACNLCKTYELYWSEKGNLGCKIVHQRNIKIRPTLELPFPLITIVAEPQPGDTWYLKGVRNISQAYRKAYFGLTEST